MLTNGFRIEAERHEFAGGDVKLFTATGEIRIPASSVRSFEAIDRPAPPPKPAEPAPAAKAAVQPPADPRQLVEKAAEKYGLPPAFLHSVARVESGYQSSAISNKGAIGIMQLMPATAAELRADPYDPAQNVEAGARHLAGLLDKYDGSSAKALAAYNAGPGAVAKYGGVPPYQETQSYVRKVIGNYKKLSAPAPPR